MNNQPSVSRGNCKNYRRGNRKPGSSPRKPQRLPEVLTHEEREALLRQPNAKNLTGLRNLCLVRLMLNTGLRAARCFKSEPGTSIGAVATLWCAKVKAIKIAAYGSETRTWRSYNSGWQEKPGYPKVSGYLPTATAN